MSVQLPPCIATCLAQDNAHDTDGLAQCFAADAVVRDEGRTIEGLAAIMAWKAASQEKYRHSIEPIGVIEADGKTVVTARVSGQFPGSPVNLQFVFGLQGGKITTLEIH